MPPATYVKANMECNIFSNLLIDLPPMTMILCMNLMISLAYFLAKSFINKLSKKGQSKGVNQTSSDIDCLMEDKQETSKLIKASSWINYNYGIRFFVLYARSMSMEIISFAFINLTSFDSSYSMVIGALFSLITIVYFLFIGFIVIRCCKYILEKRKYMESQQGKKDIL